MDERLTDGRRIAELLASELDGLGDSLAAVAVVDADPDVEPTPDGGFAYRVAFEGESGETTLAEVFVHPERAHIEFGVARSTAADAASDERLRVRPTATRPPRTLVFVEDGAEVKRAVAVVEAALAALDDGDAADERAL